VGFGGDGRLLLRGKDGWDAGPRAGRLDGSLELEMSGTRIGFGVGVDGGRRMVET
jgi:hypothetical protein